MHFQRSAQRFEVEKSLNLLSTPALIIVIADILRDVGRDRFKKRSLGLGPRSRSDSMSVKDPASAGFHPHGLRF